MTILNDLAYRLCREISPGFRQLVFRRRNCQVPTDRSVNSLFLHRMNERVKDTILHMNLLGEKGEPFMFIIDYQCARAHVFKPGDLEKENILFKVE